MSSKRIQPRVLKGFRDYLPTEMMPKQKMLAAITDVFERHGFSPLRTPILEYSDIVLGKSGTEAEKLYYRFEDNGGRDVCMRYELTISHARAVAQHAEIARPFKMYQIGPVWRAENTGHGRMREFYQCDVDVVGAKGAVPEYECLQIDYDVLKALGIDNFVIHLSNRHLLNALTGVLELDTDARRKAVARTIDKLAGQGEDVVRKLLEEEAELTQEQIEQVFAYLNISGTNDEILEQADRFFKDNSSSDAVAAEATQGIENLTTLLALCRAGGIPEGYVKLDLTIVRGLDYYTDAVYETFLTDMPSLGSVMSGGRYDGLIGMFTGQETPAVGISVGIDRLFAGLQEMGRVESTPSATKVLVTVFNEDTQVPAVSAAGQLRSLGIATEIAMGKGGLGKQLKYANKQSIPYALMLGPDEIEAGTMTLRDMESGDQHTCTSPEEAAAIVQK